MGCAVAKMIAGTGSGTGVVCFLSIGFPRDFVVGIEIISKKIERNLGSYFHEQQVAKKFRFFFSVFLLFLLRLALQDLVKKPKEIIYSKMWEISRPIYRIKSSSRE